MSWFQLWTVCWQVTIFLTPLFLGAVILWLNSRFVTKTEAANERTRIDAQHATDKTERDQRYDFLRERSQDHESRLRMVEADVAKPPSRHTLNNAISVMQGGIHSLGRSMDQIRTQMEAQAVEMRRQMEAQGEEFRRQNETQGQYLRALVEKHLA